MNALFASDNVTSACPEVMDAVIAANSGIAGSYGDDEWSLALKNKLSEIFETEVEVFLAVTGTASNALALSALAPVFGKIYCHELSHINTDECGAPELFTGGAKLIPMRSSNGRIDATDLAETIRGSGNVHVTQPSVVSVTMSCETGTVYQLDEIKAISKIAHDNKMSVHMDGARFANALVSLDVSPAEMTWKSGVDVLTLGGTKNGCLAAEAVVFFKPQMVGNFPFLHKRSGQLLSKMRFISSQLEAYLTGDVWLRNARHANAMAKILSEGLDSFANIKLAYPTQSNEVFVHLPRDVIDYLNSSGYEINEEELDGKAVRFVTAWNSELKDINDLLDTLAQKY
ncbi:MAG: low specificity L-threonine aldolase [Candidatus Thioglobus sp.]|jgi:threonine aldolase|nr:low specificity L-threonine aldolase [Candidatus Pseudothioglobus aerophilus]MBT3440402.1 low specificity L-threonine aldolase [Gammaproteobacteria bacterium]MBT5978654.1 low specificity L-threonine aldolase [Gammaproteobacteria bacterium]MBT6634016.1 low specificity L-threonine aldolase [Gammaproteobacteria bacterium]